MNKRIPEHLLLQLNEFIASAMALQFPRDRWNDLERRIYSAAEEFGFSNKEEFVQRLISLPLDREHTEILASHLTVSETYFWREPRIFEALEKHILPELIRSRKSGERRLRIWSAGCATGEEPYSIAIALKRAISGLDDWHVTILATDINTRILCKAMAGVYGKWSFRNAPEWLEKNYFRRLEDGRLEIMPEIRNMVTFEYLNLSEDIYPSPLNNTNGMDLVFCRNVLMYFAPEHSVQIGKRLHQSLIDGGWLIVGASELSVQIFPQFTSVHFPGATAYRKVFQVCLPPAIFTFKETGTRQASDESPFDNLYEAEPVLSCRLCEPVKEDFRLKAIESPKDLKPPVNAAIPDVFEIQEEIGALKPEITVSVRSLADKGRLAEALALCEKALGVDKLDPEMHYLRAVILQERNDEEEAISSLKRALYINSTFIPANFLLGNLLIRRGNTHAGKRCLKHLAALLKNHPYEEILPESDGLTAGRLREIIEATVRLIIEH